MYNLNWSRDELQNRQKLGTFGEYYAKMTLVYHGYEGKKSDPEYGVNVSKKNLPQLDCYKIEKCIEKLVK